MLKRREQIRLLFTPAAGWVTQSLHAWVADASRYPGMDQRVHKQNLPALPADTFGGDPGAAARPWLLKDRGSCFAPTRAGGRGRDARRVECLKYRTGDCREGASARDKAFPGGFDSTRSTSEVVIESSRHLSSKAPTSNHCSFTKKSISSASPRADIWILARLETKMLCSTAGLRRRKTKPCGAYMYMCTAGWTG